VCAVCILVDGFLNTQLVSTDNLISWSFTIYDHLGLLSDSVRYVKNVKALWEFDLLASVWFGFLKTKTEQKFGFRTSLLKGHRQRISTVSYKTIFRKINTEETFLPFTVITNKVYFFKKFAKFTQLLSWYYVIYIYGGCDVIGDNCNIVCKYCLFIS